MKCKRMAAIVPIIVALAAIAGIAYAQERTPTATPESTEVATAAPTVAPSPVVTATAATIATETIFPARQAVVKRTLDGGSVEVVFTDNGEIATVLLASIKAPRALENIECFGRESAEYAAQAYQNNPLITIEPTGPVVDGQLQGYVRLIDGTLLNELMVLFGYARANAASSGEYADRIKAAEEQSKKGRTGLWRVCGEDEQPLKPCFVFTHSELDSKSKRAIIEEYPDADVMRVRFLSLHYDPVQHEVIVLWDLTVPAWPSSHGWRVREYYRLSDCLRDRSEAFKLE